MNLIKEKNRLLRLYRIIIFTLIFISSAYVLAYDEEQVRNTNERVQLIAKGEIKLDKSPYSVANVRFSSPNPELLTPPPASKYYETISPKKLIKLRFPPQHYRQKKFGKQKIRQTYASDTKGRGVSFNKDINGVKRFCNTNATTHFCNREGETTIRYMGNTPRRHSREIDYRDKNIFHKKLESEKFTQQLLKQPKR